MNDKFWGLIGLAIKAGAAVFGAEATERGARRGKVKLIIADGGLSKGSLQKMQSVCRMTGIQLLSIYPEGTLGEHLPKECKWLGITQAGFADQLIQIFYNSDKNAEV